MMSRSTRRLAGSDLDYAGNESDVRTEVSCPNNDVCKSLAIIFFGSNQNHTCVRTCMSVQ